MISNTLSVTTGKGFKNKIRKLWKVFDKSKRESGKLLRERETDEKQTRNYKFMTG